MPFPAIFIPSSLAVLGLLSILAQVVLMRELHVAFYGVELAYLIAVGIWLFWTAIGALLGGRFRKPSPGGVTLLLIVFASVMIPEVLFIRAGRILFAAVPGALLPLSYQIILAFVSLMPAGLLLGCLFPWAASIYMADRGSLARAYAIECAGGVADGLAVTIAIMCGVQNLVIGITGAMLAIAVSWLGIYGKQRVSERIVVIILAGLSSILFWQARAIDHWTAAWSHPDILETKDTAYGRITVTSLAGQISVFENDALSFDTGGTDAETFAHLTALQHPNPQKILLLGGGIEGIVLELIKHKPGRIDYVEINPAMLSMVLPHLPINIRSSLQDPRVHITIADPRRFLLERSDLYDQILIGMPEPISGQANRFYTHEFFSWCAARLKPGGLIAFRLRSAENYWTPQLALRAASIYGALKSIFPEVSVLPGTTDFFTASAIPLPSSPEPLIKRYTARGIQGRFITPSYIRYLFTNDRFFEAQRRLAAIEVPANTDLRPVCYRFSLFIWLSKFFPRLAWQKVSMDHGGLTDNPTMWGLVIAGIFLLVRFRPNARRITFVAAAAFTGMILETVLILYYQLKRGLLFQDIGILLTSFMAGLMIGALALERVLHDSKVGWRLAVWRAGMAAGFILLGSLTYWIMMAGENTSLVVSAALLAAAGFLVAGVFTLASYEGKGEARRAASLLYSADLAGGCFGSLIGSLALIPLAGLDTTILGMIALSVLLFLLI